MEFVLVSGHGLHAPGAGIPCRLLVAVLGPLSSRHVLEPGGMLLLHGVCEADNGGVNFASLVVLMHQGPIPGKMSCRIQSVEAWTAKWFVLWLSSIVDHWERLTDNLRNDYKCSFKNSALNIHLKLLREKIVNPPIIDY